MWRLHNIKEAFFATVIILLCCLLIYFVSTRFNLFSGLQADANGRNLYDFFHLEKNKNYKGRDTNIVLVQVENGRGKIADQLKLIESAKPAVIGIDAVFTARKDSSGDNKLVRAIRSANNIVLASRLNAQNQNEVPELAFFISPDSNYHCGYINLETDRYKVVRSYMPSSKIDNKTLFSFTSEILRLYAPGSLKRRKEEDSNFPKTINYFGNTENYTAITAGELVEYYRKHQLSSLIKSKIVLLGYFVKYPPFDKEDIHFSPLNPKVGNNANPDMYGVVVHANILSMMLSNSHPKITSTAISFLVAFVFVFLLMAYVINAYAQKDSAPYSKLLLAQVGLIFFVFYGLLQVYNLYSWQVPLSPVLIALILPALLLSVYRVIALKLHKNLNYKTAFS